MYDVTARVGEEQIQAIQRQEYVQEILKGLVPGLSQRVGTELGLAPDLTANEGLGIGAADEQLVRQLGEEEMTAGYSDLDTQYQEGLGMLRNELAPARGLRPGDTPIVDRGGLMLKETLRQKAQLGRSVRAGTSGRLLDLAGRARQNRLQLLSGLSGLGIAPQGQTTEAAGQMAQSRAGQGTTTGSAPNTSLIGTGLMTAAYLICSAERKNLTAAVDAKSVLAKLRALPLYRWSYKGETTPHMGPTAEDFRHHFGVGDGKTINLIDVVGVLLGAMKGLAEEAAHGTA